MAKIEKRVVSHWAQLNRYFGRGILTTFSVCGTEAKTTLQSSYDGKTATISTFDVDCNTIQSLFVAEISDSEFILLDTKVYKSESFNRESTLDTQTQIIKRRRPSNTWIFILRCREVLSVWLSSQILYGRAYANSLFLFSQMLRLSSAHSVFLKLI